MWANVTGNKNVQLKLYKNTAIKLPDSLIDRIKQYIVDDDDYKTTYEMPYAVWNELFNTHA